MITRTTLVRSRDKDTESKDRKDKLRSDNKVER